MGPILHKGAVMSTMHNDIRMVQVMRGVALNLSDFNGLQWELCGFKLWLNFLTQAGSCILMTKMLVSESCFLLSDVFANTDCDREVEFLLLNWVLGDLSS